MRRYLVNFIEMSSFEGYRNHGQFTISAEVPNDFVHLIHQKLASLVFPEGFPNDYEDYDFSKFVSECFIVANTVRWSDGSDVEYIAEIINLEDVACVNF